MHMQNELQTTDTVIYRRPTQLLTLAGPAVARAGGAMAELGMRRDFSVVTQGHKIAWVGPDDELDTDTYRYAREVDCRGRVVMPALCDSHTHLVWGGDRKDELELRLRGADYEEIFAAGGGILSSVRQTRALDDNQLYTQSLRRVRRMQRAGTTTFEIKSGYGLDLETELRQLEVAKRLREQAGVRTVSTCLAAHAIPAEFRGSDRKRAAFVEHVCSEILPAVAEQQLATYCDVFCDRGAFTRDEARQIFARGRALGLKPRVHANEFGHTGGALLAAELQAASADHLLYLNADERAALRDAGVVATLLPGTSTVLGKPFADGRALVEAGVAVAVATDCNPGSCAFESLAMVLGLACYGCRLTPAEAICAATHNAACALDLQSQVGRIEVGLDADLVVLDTDDYRDLVYHTGSPLVGATISRGVFLSSLQ